MFSSMGKILSSMKIVLVIDLAQYIISISPNSARIECDLG